MRWLVVVRNIDTGRMEIITPDTDLDACTSRYDDVVHILPFKTEPDPQRLDFGIHELHDACACHPKITKRELTDQTVIKHQAAVN